MKLNWTDKLVGYLSPKAGLERSYYRSQMENIGAIRQRSFEAAEKTKKNTSWKTGKTSMNFVLQNQVISLRARSTDLFKNNPHANRAVKVASNNVVGQGIKPQFLHANLDKKNEITKTFSKFADTSACDFEERSTLYSLQNMWDERIRLDGGILIQRVPKVGPRKAQSVSFELKTIPVDYLDHNMNQDLVGGAKIRNGIEFSKDGKVTAYHLFKNDPNESTMQDRVRIDKKDIIYQFDQVEPGQRLGIPWLAPVANTLRNLDTLYDAALQKQIVSAAFAAFITKSEAGEFDDEVEIPDSISSGTIAKLPAGYDFKTTNPPQAADFGSFAKQFLCSIGSGIGITYEALSQDWSNVNFSSARMGFLEFQRMVRRWQSKVMKPILDTVFDWFVEDLEMMSGLSLREELDVEWSFPAAEMIDPVKEVAAAAEAISTNQTTVSEVLRSRGKDPEIVFKERSEELKKMRELGILQEPVPEAKDSNAATKKEVDPSKVA